MNASESSNNSDTGTPAHKRSFFNRLIKYLKKYFHTEPTNRAQLLAILQEANKNEVLSFDALTMIEGVLQVSDMQVRDIMIPRSQMIVIEKDTALEEFLPVMIESGHSRFPVIGNNRDEVLGTLLAKDLLPFIIKSDQKINIKELLRPAMVIPESKRLNILLKEFRANKQHMAIIADEYGGISGLITIEDVLEQIVGDIEDEFDTEDTEYIIEQRPNVFQVQALTPIEDFNDYFESNFSDEEFDTIGGLVLHEIGHLPKKNETTTIQGFKIKVLNADKRRIRLLLVTKNEKTENNTNSEKPETLSNK